MHSKIVEEDGDLLASKLSHQLFEIDNEVPSLDSTLSDVYHLNPFFIRDTSDGAHVAAVGPGHLDGDVLALAAECQLETAVSGEDHFIHEDDLPSISKGLVQVFTDTLNCLMIPRLCLPGRDLLHFDSLEGDSVVLVNLRETPRFDELVRELTMEEYGSSLKGLSSPLLQFTLVGEESNMLVRNLVLGRIFLDSRGDAVIRNASSTYFLILLVAGLLYLQMSLTVACFMLRSFAMDA